MTFKKILCGVDFSQPSLRAFQTAVQLARQSKAELHLLHVIEAQPVVPGLVPAAGLSETMLMLEGKANAAIQSLLKSQSRLLKNLKVTSEIDQGSAFVEILNHVRDAGADVIVVGARGLVSVDDIFAGSTVENLVRQAPCSLLVVR